MVCVVVCFPEMVHNIDAKAQLWKSGEDFGDWEVIVIKSMETRIMAECCDAQRLRTKKGSLQGV